MPPVLPGFHYDRERRKYFKVTPNQHASGASSSYSKAAVAKEETNYKEGNTLEEWHERLRKTRVERNYLTQAHPLGGMLGLRRELGNQEGRIEFAAAAVWAKGLERYNFIEKPAPSDAEPTRNIRDFVRDPGTGAIIWTEDWSSHPHHVNVPQVKVPIPAPDGSPNNVSRYLMDDGKPLGVMPDSETSSATGLGMSKPPSLHIIRLLQPSEYVINLNNFRDWRRRHNYHPQTAYLPEIDAQVASVVRLPGKVKTVWCSAAGPHAHHPIFAVGTSHGAKLVGLRDESVETWLQEYDWPDDERTHDTFAVEFWNPNNVLCGMRSGKVRMWDIRANGANVRLQHGSCVSHIQAIDEHKILVAGLRDQLSVYDTRFITPLIQPRPPSRGKAKDPAYHPPHPPSLPLHTFPSYRMKEYLYPRLGFDVHRNLVASGTEDQKVQIFDLKSGLELGVGQDQDLLPNDRLTGHARCLKFVEHEFNGDGLRLLVANGTRINAWAW
ncbi:MAG: hypothetical protein LQ341_005818 [Variospora aurantia]|nr:MAG: hypothetical protein LQ341_005818 [Variospora aurantia]